jgi:D-aminopeptidase
MTRPRVRDLGLLLGDLPPGPENAITDVAGVRVGHTTLCRGEGPLRPGEGPVRTGVTVILPHDGNLFRHKVPAAVHTINGFGKATGFEQVRELGTLEAPIALTNTLNVGLVADALVQHAIRQSPEIGIQTGSVNVVVGECNDGYLNDLQGRHVRAEQVWAALEAATAGPVAEGAVGAGTGTRGFSWKAGIGTASRVLPADLGAFTVGALVQTNMGRPGDLILAGFPVGRHLRPPQPGCSSLSYAQGRTACGFSFAETAGAEKGSIMIVLATDAPLTAHQLRRLGVRVAAGLARTGSTLSHGSGDFVIAFSTAYRLPHKPPALTLDRPMVVAGRVLNRLFQAVVESVEEAVVNSLFCAETVVGRDGHTAYALPTAEAVALVQQARRGERP